ncbi:rhamnulose-1-phosphate aldolase [Bacillus changyiensis]|uniref:rhamnulose-1-phosphate aldolase n=1 Tax=Bacillus changyiensis TaxID=3004103 RepID=UPI0022E942EB|nr:rhamnulose-1-phosphate aldolase [Bacillus changyiensis]MDA1476130.1 rhamnulose-1-phosphate aldolase [Bacillus changyiensis]
MNQHVEQDQLVINAPFVQEMMETTYNMWRLGWDERNGGNISYILSEEEVSAYLDPKRVLKTIDLDFPVIELANQYFIVTGSGKYFKNVKKNPAECLGIIHVNENGKSIHLLWGLIGDGKPTSELPSHFRSHISRLHQDKNHRVIMHTHATNIIAMTFTHELDEKNFSKTLWKMCTECIVVFPEGIRLLPWMVPGTDKIGQATAKKMNEARLVVWPFHGIFGAGESIDDAFGLIETAEKAAQVYMLASAHQGGIIQDMTDQNLIELAKAFHVEPNQNYL